VRTGFKRKVEIVIHTIETNNSDPS
jgi:hypothetical protein